LTIHLSADATGDSYDIDGSTLSLSDLGFRKVVVDDGHAGQHHPRGSPIVYGSKAAVKRSELIDYLEYAYLEYAPAMCGYFNIARRNYMQTPTLAF
jgi:hypothetical protein